MVEDASVLVAGAGPTGLYLALVLARLGVAVRVVDPELEPGTTSRALVLQARTLELYRQLDLADAVVARSLRLDGVNLWLRGERVARFGLGAIGEGKTPYPVALIFPQDEHERFLIDRLRDAGVEVERGTRVVAVENRSTSVRVELQAGDGTTSTCEAAYVAGCDGARSTVRRAIGADFPGGTYDHLFYVADVDASGPLTNDELHVVIDDAGFLGVFPLAGGRRVRLIGTVLEDLVASGASFGWDDVDHRPIEAIGLVVDRVNWFSTYHVHHRVADRFRSGRVFLLGDAAHIHSPVGGQGMNTGLGDAMNLAWKLAAVLDHRAHDDLLDTYEVERIAFARKLVATTDRVFQLVSSESRIAELVRTNLVPRLVPRFVKTAIGRRFLFRTVSQTGIEVRDSPWSGETLGPVHAGDRLPWVGELDNFAPLRSVDWQMHVYERGSREGIAELRAFAEARRIPLHVFHMQQPAKHAALRDDAVYLVRPDGYLGAVPPLDEAPSRLAAYLDAHGIRPRI